MFNALEPWHIIVILVVLVLLFGSKRLPDAARGIGKSLRIFKSEAKSLREEAEQPATSIPLAPNVAAPNMAEPVAVSHEQQR